MGLLHYVFLVFIIDLISIQHTESNGKFQLKMLKLINLHNDQCCGNIRRQPYRGISSTQCSMQCSTMFNLYLQSDQSDGKRYLVNTSTLVLGSELSNDEDGLLEIHFTFPWMKNFAITLEVYVHNHYTERNTLIEITSYSGILKPGAKWQTLNRRSDKTIITYQIRVGCSANYYDEFCTKYCKPRNDQFGHYYCSGNGDRDCEDGWDGDNCDKVVCKAGCHPVHGWCSAPGECKCQLGWKGELCDQRVPYPGSKISTNTVHINGLCTWDNQYYANNATWQVRCNLCTCENSIVKCTKVWCGPENCLSGKQLAVSGSLQVCVPLSAANCLLEPCRPWGEFRPLNSNGFQSSNGHSLYPLETKCWPNEPILRKHLCSRAQLVLDRTKLPIGTTLESFCATLRTVLAHHLSSRKLYDDLFLLCGSKNELGPKTTVEITYSTFDGSMTNIMDEVTVMLNGFLTNNQTVETELMAVVDVKMEDAVAESPCDNGTLLLIGSGLTVIFIVCVIVNVVIVCLRRNSSTFVECDLSNVRQYNGNQVEKIVNNLRYDKNSTKCYVN